MTQPPDVPALPEAYLDVTCWYTAEQMRAYAEAYAAAKLAQVQRDALRLDWVEARWRDGIHLELCAGNPGLTWHGLKPAATVFYHTGSSIGDTLRAAIDAAMKDSHD